MSTKANRSPRATVAAVRAMAQARHMEAALPTAAEQPTRIVAAKGIPLGPAAAHLARVGDPRMQVTAAIARNPIEAERTAATAIVVPAIVVPAIPVPAIVAPAIAEPRVSTVVREAIEAQVTVAL